MRKFYKTLFPWFVVAQIPTGVPCTDSMLHGMLLQMPRRIGIAWGRADHLLSCSTEYFLAKHLIDPYSDIKLSDSEFSPVVVSLLDVL